MFDAKNEDLAVILRSTRDAFNAYAVPNIIVASSSDYQAVLESPLDNIIEWKAYLFNLNHGVLSICQEFQRMFTVFRMAEYATNLYWTLKVGSLDRTKVIEQSTLEYLNNVRYSTNLSEMFKSYNGFTVEEFIGTFYHGLSDNKLKALSYIFDMILKLKELKGKLDNGDIISSELKAEFSITEPVTQIILEDEAAVDDLKKWVDHVKLNEYAVETLYQGLFAQTNQRLTQDEINNINQLTFLLNAN